MYATFIIPAQQGCNLRCPYCAVAHRKEATRNVVSHEQYIAFVRGLPTGVQKVIIAGFEPTLDDSADLAIEMLSMAKEDGIPTVMNTNGINLPAHLERFAVVCDTVMISLDSHDATVCDQIRRGTNVFMQTTRGIHDAIARMSPQRVIVNTLLMPNGADYIRGLPEVLNGLGVTQWVISPYINYHSGRIGPKFDFITSTVTELAQEAEAQGITTMYADETGHIGPIRTIPIYNFYFPGRPTFRLAPNGTCSVNEQILTDSSAAAVWNGIENPADFLARIIPSS